MVAKYLKKSSQDDQDVIIIFEIIPKISSYDCETNPQIRPRRASEASQRVGPGC